MADSDEMKMTGLILAQSALVGIAIGIFDSGLWVPVGTGDAWISGVTYAMGALALQTIAYYLFKMFFEQGMQEKVRMAEMQRQRQQQFKQQEFGFNQRVMEMELMQRELQIENELRMLHENPNRISPGYNSGTVGVGIQGDYHNTQGVPIHNAEVEQPLNLGLSEAQVAADILRERNIPNPPPPSSAIPLKKDGTPDLRYKSPPQ